MAVVPDPPAASWLQFSQPEVTSVVRWFLRVILVVFLAWLLRKRPEKEEEEGEEDEADDAGQLDGRRGGVKTRPANARSVARLQDARGPTRRDGYGAGDRDLRQRRGQYGGQGDVDSVIDRVSKPQARELWEVRRSGEGPPQILPKRPPREGDGASGTAAAGAAAAAGGAAPGPSSSLASLMASMGAGPPSAPSGGGGGGMASPAGPGERPRLVMAPRSELMLKRHEADPHEKMLHGHQRPVTFITWNRDGNLLFTCGKDKLVCVWSIPDGECLGTYEGHSGAVWACSVTHDSRWLVTGGADQNVIVWEARESRELARKALPGVVRSVEWAKGGSSSSERFVTCHNRFGSHPAAVTVWQFDGTVVEELFSITTLPSAASQVRWGRDDQLLASAHEKGELVFWRADDGKEVQRLQAHDSAITKFEFSQDRQLVATASHDKSIRIWDLGEGGSGDQPRQLYHVETDRPINDVALGPLSRETACGPLGGRPAKCCVIGAGGQDARQVTTCGSTTEQFNTLLFKLPQSDEFPAILEADGVTKGHFGPVHTLAFAPDGSAIASGSEDGCVRLHFFVPPGPAAPGGRRDSRGTEGTPTDSPAAGAPAPATEDPADD